MKATGFSATPLYEMFEIVISAKILDKLAEYRRTWSEYTHCSQLVYHKFPRKRTQRSVFWFFGRVYIVQL